LLIGFKSNFTLLQPVTYLIQANQKSSWSEISSFILLVRLPDGLSPLLIWAGFSQSIVSLEVENL